MEKTGTGEGVRPPLLEQPLFAWTLAPLRLEEHILNGLCVAAGSDSQAF